MIIESGLVVGYLAAWAARKAGRVGRRLDDEVDNVMDAALDKLHETVASKLGTDTAVAQLEAEASSGVIVDDLTRQRVELSLQAAVRNDPAFAAALSEAALQVQSAEKAAGPVIAAGANSTAVAGDMNIKAEHGSAAAQTMGDVTFGAPAGGKDPH